MNVLLYAGDLKISRLTVLEQNFVDGAFSLQILKLDTENIDWIPTRHFLIFLSQKISIQTSRNSKSDAFFHLRVDAAAKAVQNSIELRLNSMLIFYNSLFVERERESPVDNSKLCN